MVKILTDSSCDIELSICEKMGVEVIPINVHFGDKTYTPGVDLSKAEFYEKLAKAEKTPTTTQVSPMTFEEYFSKHIENGDEILGMFISKELSGTYQNAVLNAQKISRDKIHIVDTLNTTFGLGLLIYIAVEYRDKGLSAVEIKAKIEELVPRVCLYASIDTLKYLKMGGRLSAGAAIVAGVLGISPIISVQEGKVCAVAKARGKVACLDYIAKRIDQDGISSDYPVALGHSDSLETLKNGEKHLSSKLAKKETIKMSIGSVIGSHIGPGAFGIAYIKK